MRKHKRYRKELETYSPFLVRIFLILNNYTIQRINLLDEDLLVANNEVFGQYKAALALVPCDAQALSVFTAPLINIENAVSVVFVYSKPIEKLKS